MTECAVLGTTGIISCFSAVGVDPFVLEMQDVRAKLFTLAKIYKIIFVTEDVFQEFEADIKKLSAGAYPIIVEIPTKQSEEENAIQRIKSTITSCLGIKISKGDENAG